MRRKALIASVAAALAMVAGCGDSAKFEVQGDTTVVPQSSMTKATFIGEANKICMRNWHVVMESFLKHREGLRTSDPGLTAKQRFIRATRSAYFSALEAQIVAKIRRLGAPPGERQAVEELIGALQEAIERGQRLSPLTTRPEVREHLDDYNRLARRYGVRECVVGLLSLPRGQF